MRDQRNHQNSRQQVSLGENGQIPPFSEICSKKALFHNLLVIYHFSSTRVLQTRVLNGTRVYETRVPKSSATVALPT